MTGRPDDLAGADTATTTPERPRRTNLAIFVAVLLVAAAVVAGFVLLRSPDEPTGTDGEIKRTTVAKFSGDGNEVTERFEVDEGWQIHWDTQGKGFRFSIDGEEFDYGTVINEKRAGSGVTSPVGEGTFRLNVKAKGPWSIQIIQGEPPPEQNDE